MPTRSLDPFETAALEQLWTQQDVVIDDQSERIRMLGALRASQVCLECHSVPYGYLLGAFSYELLKSAGDRESPLSTDSPEG